MLRLPLLMMTSLILAQVVPQGCTPAAPEPIPGERGTIETQASAAGTATVNQRISLNATAEGEGVTFAWLQVAGPGVKIDNADSASASFVAPSLQEAKTLRFQVTTHNADGDVGLAEVKVVVQSDPNFGYSVTPAPGGGSTSSLVIARAGADQSVTEKTTATLDGSNSVGNELRFQWRQTSGTTVSLTNAGGVRATFTAPAFVTDGANRLEFELKVVDQAGRYALDRIFVAITKDTNDTSTPLTRVRVRTTRGNFVMELEDRKSPKHVANFLRYVDDNYYDNTIFHRVIPGFVIQGGGYTTGLAEKTPRTPVQTESNNGLSNVRTTVALALKASDPNSGTSQFFVNLVDNTFLDQQQFTVFARVIEGMDVVDLIAASPTTSQNGFEDVPVDEIIIQDVERL